MCVLPTGYGKSLIFHLMPLLFAKHELDSDSFGGISSEDVNTIVIVISPLNSLMSNQISRLSLSGIRAAVLSVKVGSDDSEENIQIDFSLCEEDKLRNGYYHIVLPILSR